MVTVVGVWMVVGAGGGTIWGTHWGNGGLVLMRGKSTDHLLPSIGDSFSFILPLPFLEFSILRWSRTEISLQP